MENLSIDEIYLIFELLQESLVQKQSMFQKDYLHLEEVVDVMLL